MVGTARSVGVRQGTVWHGTAGMAGKGTFRLVWLGTVWQVRRGMARFGKFGQVLAGMAGFGEERRGLSRQVRQARRGREWFGRSWAAGEDGFGWSGLVGRGR